MAFQGWHLIVIEWCMVAIAFLFLILRLYARLYCRPQGTRSPLCKKWQWSDTLALASWLFFAGQSCMDTALFKFGMFEDNIDPLKLAYGLRNAAALKIYFAENCTYFLALYCVKGAVLLLYHEFIPVFMRKSRIALWIVDILVATTCLAGILCNLLYCRPFNTNWSTDPKTYCSALYDIYIDSLLFGSHIITDILIYCLPLGVLRTLTLPRWQKVGLFLTFGVGFLSVLFAILGILTPIITSSFTISYFFTVMEQSWAVILVCFPYIRWIIAKEKQKKGVGSTIFASSGNASSLGNASVTMGTPPGCKTPSPSRKNSAFRIPPGFGEYGGALVPGGSKTPSPSRKNSTFKVPQSFEDELTLAVISA